MADPSKQASTTVSITNNFVLQFSVPASVAPDATATFSLGGWSYTGVGPAQFDGAYALERLATGHSYLVYGEPWNGAADPSQIGKAVTSLCRNSSTGGGWSVLQSCVMPAANVSFTVRTRPGP